MIIILWLLEDTSTGLRCYDEAAADVLRLINELRCVWKAEPLAVFTAKKWRIGDLETHERRETAAPLDFLSLEVVCYIATSRSLAVSLDISMTC